MSTFLFFSEGQQPLFPSRITLSLDDEDLSLSSDITRQFVISFITTVTIHYSFSLPLQAQNSSFPQILSSNIVLLPLNPPD